MAWPSVFRARGMAVLFVLGFLSGLPLLLTGQTLQAWLTAEHVPLARIAAVSSVGLACTFKFAWAPLLDRFQLPVLGGGAAGCWCSSSIWSADDSERECCERVSVG